MSGEVARGQKTPESAASTAAFPRGRTSNGREVIVCYCGGGDPHEWKPNGGGARILACPPGEPTPLHHTRKGLDRG